MSSLKIILIEDEKDSIDTFTRSCEIFTRKNDIAIDPKIYTNIPEFMLDLENVLDSDGIVIDMKLHTEKGEESGSDIVSFFANNNIVIPTVIFTGTNDVAISNHPFITIKIKGETDISKDILENFYKIKCTGIIDIIGGKGVLRKYLYDVFHKNFDKQKEIWFSHTAGDLEQVKTALLRHTVNHLNQYIDEENNEYYLQEMYIYPPIATKIKPGSILKGNSDHKNYIVLTPACDLVRENSHCILLAEIVSHKSIISAKIKGEGSSKARIKEFNRFVKNNNPNYHFLPEMFDFNGGFVDFASLKSIAPNELVSNYSGTLIQVSNSFIVDITARFAIYYSRQGQPDLRHQEETFSDLLNETPHINSVPAQ